MNLTEHDKSAIIGMWRMGVPNDLIAIYTGHLWRYVCKVIEDYKEILLLQMTEETYTEEL